jgi:hypothetical protein
MISGVNDQASPADSISRCNPRLPWPNTLHTGCATFVAVVESAGRREDCLSPRGVTPCSPSRVARDARPAEDGRLRSGPLRAA